MRTLIALFTVILTSVAYAQVDVDTQDFDVPEQVTMTLSVDWLSEYVADGIVFLDKPVVQTDLYVTLPHGIYLDIWHSVGLNDGNFSSDFGDEIDYTIGWSGNIKDNLVLNVGIAYFDLVDVGTFSSDMVQLYAELSTEAEVGNLTISPFIELEQHWVVGWPGVEGGLQVITGVRHNTPLFLDDLDLSQRFQITYDSGVAGFDSGFIGEYCAGISWQVTDMMSVTPIQLKISSPLGSMDDNRETEMVWGFGASILF